eukprot:CAMPEP_0206543574 /NCGR_PEP_ID=MMETSP0325_2-20121206/10958_1 /ASSEMBLY_ACC=CAM_ASM_000347 /TAXON_ID=2866 /ORGANISM="Crypthecodinium cohnii, Strain Seligo" /LENGTH=98 /DNA_ID=CAMNT_0054042067 /DNA_START=90 /DNA_END=383 /DNA_ORIENTATION=-
MDKKHRGEGAVQGDNKHRNNRNNVLNEIPKEANMSQVLSSKGRHHKKGSTLLECACSSKPCGSSKVDSYIGPGESPVGEMHEEERPNIVQTRDEVSSK